MAQTVTLTDGRTVTFPDGMSREDMAAALSQVPPLAASHEPQAETPAQMVNVGGRGTALDLRKSRARMTEALPTIGATAGSLVGGLTSPVTGPVGPVVGAGLGGSLGTAAQSLVQGQSPDANAVIESGLGNASLQAVAPIGGLVAKGLYKGGVALLPKGIKQAYPDLAEAGFREGVALTRRGAEKAEGLMGASRAEADALVQQAENAGKRVSRFDVIRELRPVAQKTAQGARLGRTNDTPAVVDRAKSFLRRNPSDLKPTDAQALKREAQDLATTAYKAQERGAPVNSTDLLMDEATARGLRKGLERIAPEVGAVNARTQDLLGLTQAADHASQTGHVLSRLGGAGVFGAMASPAGAIPAVAAAAAGTAMTTPGGLTATGLALKPIAAHLPAAVRSALLLELLASHEQEQ